MQYNEFLNWVDVKRFAKACYNISNSDGAQVLNQHSNRMLKEKYLLGALQMCNHAKNIQLVDAIDYDLIFDQWNETVEVKTGDGPMYTEKKGLPKKFVEVKLKNIYESKANTRTTLDKTFDHLMIVQNSGTFAIGFVPFNIVEKHLVSLSDGWKARIPFDKVTMVYTQDMRQHPITWTTDLGPMPWIFDTLAKAGV